MQLLWLTLNSYHPGVAPSISTRISSNILPLRHHIGRSNFNPSHSINIRSTGANQGFGGPAGPHASCNAAPGSPEEQLVEKLRRIEALFARAGSEAGLIQSISTSWALADASPSPEVPCCRASPPGCRHESTEIRPAVAG